MKMKVRKNFPAEIRDEDELEEAIEEFGLNYCKASPYLKRKKDIAMKAVKSDPFNIMFMKNIDVEVGEEAIKRKEYLSKYINPLESVIDFESPLTEYEIKLMDGERLVRNEATKLEIEKHLDEINFFDDLEAER